MNFNNKEGIKKLRLTLLIIGMCWLLTIVVFVFIENFKVVAILAGSFLAVAIFIATLNFQFVKITTANNNLTVRYYSMFSVERMFRMFEFPVNLLREVEVHKHLLGLKWNLRFTIKVKKGIADYPWVSLSAIPFSQRSKLIRELRGLITQNK